MHSDRKSDRGVGARSQRGLEVTADEVQRPERAGGDPRKQKDPARLNRGDGRSGQWEDMGRVTIDGSKGDERQGWN
jgi:hypothetical protein